MIFFVREGGRLIEPLPSTAREKCQRACKPGSVHRPSKKRDCAAIPLGDGSPRPSSNQPGRRAGTRPMWHPYSVLLPVGFTVPPPLPEARCALAAPFLPYPSEAGRYAFCGTVPDPGKPGPPGVTRHRGSMEPGLSSPETSLRRGRPALWRGAI